MGVMIQIIARTTSDFFLLRFHWLRDTLHHCSNKTCWGLYNVSTNLVHHKIKRTPSHKRYQSLFCFPSKHWQPLVSLKISRAPQHDLYKLGIKNPWDAVVPNLIPPTSSMVFISWVSLCCSPSKGSRGCMASWNVWSVCQVSYKQTRNSHISIKHAYPVWLYIVDVSWCHKLYQTYHLA